MLLMSICIMWCLAFFAYAFAGTEFPDPSEMLPKPKKDMRSGAQLRVGPGSELEAPASFSAKYAAVADSVGKTLSALPSGGVKVRVKASIWAGAAGGAKGAGPSESYLIVSGRQYSCYWT
jgi:hypothetical protein